jgi:hypothetical protein
VDPQAWLDEYGADALRFTLLRGANPGADEPIGEEQVEGSRRFGTKLWNATKFALGNGATVDTAVPPRAELTDADRWILDKADQLVSDVDTAFDSFEFARLSEGLYHFTWDEFCDWYLELAKVQISEGGARADATRAVLGSVLDTVLRLLHPLMPFVTERLWTTLTGEESLVIAPWARASGEQPDPAAALRIEAVQKLVTEIRRFRSDQGLPPGRKVPAELSGAFDADLLAHEPSVRALSRLDEPADGFAPTATLEVALSTGTVTVALDLSGVIDVAAERKRLATPGVPGDQRSISPARDDQVQRILRATPEGALSVLTAEVVTNASQVASGGRIRSAGRGSGRLRSSQQCLIRCWRDRSRAPGGGDLPGGPRSGAARARDPGQRGGHRHTGRYDKCVGPTDGVVGGVPCRVGPAVHVQGRSHRRRAVAGAGDRQGGHVGRKPPCCA